MIGHDEFARLLLLLLPLLFLTSSEFTFYFSATPSIPPTVHIHILYL